MKQNKKVISLITVLAMIMTMFSALVVNAEGEEVYTKATATETGLSLEIGYKGFADLAVGGTEVNVKIPDGFTAEAKDIALDATFASAASNVADGVIMISHNSTTDYTVSEGVIATVALTWAGDKPEVTTEYSFDVTKFVFSKPDFTTVNLTNGVTANNGTYTYKVAAVEPATQHVYVYGSEVAEGKATLTIGYKNFADLAVGGTEVNVKIPDGFTAEAKDIALDATFASAASNVADGVIMISHNSTTDYTVSEGVIATVTLTMNDGFEMPEDGVMAEITKFVFSKPDFTTVNLNNGVATYVTPVTVAGNDDGGDDGDDGDKDTVALTLDKEAVSLEQGATATVNYTVTPAGTAVTATCADTANISSVTAADGVITIVAQATATEGTYDVVVKAGDVTKTIKVTITKKVEVAFKGTLTKVADNDSFANRSYLKATFTAATEDIDAIVGTDTYVLVFDGKNGDFLAGSTLVKVSGETLKKIIAGTETIEVSIPGAVAADSSVSVLDSSYKTIAAK